MKAAARHAGSGNSVEVEFAKIWTGRVGVDFLSPVNALYLLVSARHWAVIPSARDRHIAGGDDYIAVGGNLIEEVHMLPR